MSSSGTYNSGQRYLPYRRPSSKGTNVGNRLRNENEANPPPRAPTHVSGATPFCSDNAKPRPAPINLGTQGSRHETSQENSDTAGARWPLVDPSGAIYSIEPDLMREGVSSGNSWSPASQGESPATYASLEDQDQSSDNTSPTSSLQRRGALRRSNSPRVNSISLAGTSVHSGNIASAAGRPVSPIEHDCGCRGEADGTCGKGADCCRSKTADCCRRNPHLVSPVGSRRGFRV